ncbi:MAG: hypothetical protein HY368_00615 [Candidatus Aenigmarchaeota archaeon]|nr:hypothetical protein [Candidatus Aenigmarchaeota archaeon]
MDELDRQNKTIDFLGEVLEKVQHKTVSKKHGKHECKLRIDRKTWKLVYALKDDKAFMIHLKPE